MNVKHLQTDTPTYNCWTAMRSRCTNPNDHAYSYYGGRGITVDPSWDDFEVFLADMGTRPEGLSLERIDVNGNYTPDNCIWADWSTQMSNRRMYFVNTEDPMRYIRSYGKRWRVCITLRKGHMSQTYHDTLEEALEHRANCEMEREMFRRLGGK